MKIAIKIGGQLGARAIWGLEKGLKKYALLIIIMELTWVSYVSEDGVKKWRQENTDEVMREKREEKERILKEKRKKYYMDNRDKKLEYSREYDKTHKEEIKARRNIKVVCECGCEVLKRGLTQHRKSQKHFLLSKCKT